MANLAEIEAALGVIAFGYISSPTVQPDIPAFYEAYLSDSGQKILQEKVTLLHCTTEYPTPLDDVNLRAMDTLKSAFNLPVGYSDHTEGIFVPIAAVARGAVVIEKHFTLDKNMDGPDHKASLNPEELKDMVKHIRATERIMGSGIKGPRPSELSNKAIARKSLIANVAIKQGDSFTDKNVSILRPGDGMTPFRYWELLGSHATQDFEEGQLIK